MTTTTPTTPLTDADKLYALVCDPAYSHSRSRKWCGVWMTYIYHFDAASPSGVRMVGGDMEEKVSMVLVAARRSSALSPTEGLHQGGAQ